MELNYIVSLLALLIYFPIFFLSIISKKFKGRFMMIHAKTKKDYILEFIVGINYFLIIFSFLFTSFIDIPVFFIIGLSIYILSLIVVFSGYFAFYTTPGKAMVRKWPFNFSRNPTYFFSLTALVGLSVITKSYVSLILIFIQFIFVHQIILKEEEYCEEHYKQEFISYKEKVPRYI